MKGKVNGCFDVAVYTLDGKLEKKFYNFNKEAAEEMYSYYTTKDEYVVKVDHSDTLYNLLEIKEDKRRR